MKRPTQVDVARLARVSRATVSHVVNDLAGGPIRISQATRRRVLDAIDELGYEPDVRARALRSGRTKAIGLIIPDIRNPHYWETVDGVEQEARASGYNLLLSSADLNPERGHDIFTDLSRRRIDGLILMGAFIFQSDQARGTLDRLLSRRFPIVKLGEHPDTDCVVSSYGEATKALVAHLLSLHHRRIGLIYGVLPYPGDSAVASVPAEYEGGEDRLLGYQHSLNAAGLPVDAKLTVTCGPAIEDGYRAALQLLNLPSRPTALIAINDLLAIGALRAAADSALRVPADLSLAGYDDILIARHLVPRLTTVSKDAVRLGREGAKLLITRMQEPDAPRRRVDITPQLIIRESTGPAPF